MTNDYNELLTEEIMTIPSSNENKVKLIINDAMLTKERDSESDNIFFREAKPAFFHGDGGKDFGKKLFNLTNVSDSYYTKTQKWLGHVVELNEGGFTAILKDLSNGGTEEIGEFSNDEITPDDLPLISKGAAFYMSLGFISERGTRKRESEIRFQRLAEFDENDINNRGLDTMKELINFF